MPRANHLFQYQEIAQELKEQILRGEFGVEGRLPSERALGIRFEVQRNTIRQALELLEKEGQILTQEKRGSFVRVPPSAPGPDTFLVNIHRGSSANLTHLMEGFSHISEQAGYRVRRRNTDPARGAALDHVPDPDRLPEDTAGVVLWPQNPTDAEMLGKLNRAIPLVLVDRRVLGVSADSVRFDDLAGGQMITEHLLSQGHRRIAFLTDDVFAETVQNRWHGYVLAHETNDVPVDPRLNLLFHGIDVPFFGVAMRHQLSQGKLSPTAIVCSNDLVAFTLLRFLHDEGIRVPDDLAVTGYGNSIPDYTEAMTLTTVDQPFYEVGTAAARILIDRMGQSTPERLRAAHDITIPVRLIVRASSTGSVPK
ncbi:GntR family transcriptional regulator [Fimbriimonas ginsengisoli]|uniref:Periplasmic binding protein/LacI transcriptional regulator n=1 Tax=Fimbriimonas ginsengisoli Gsoil 348 TaxID=661478 RepID=A0A068NP46_FIMGI|nr:GntR family transcriptional regulator [Fimbriimonas ginsengisoli]AIE84520.1 periplasmic binding protein/LacI transcriptional regulator [Fimbriimonas ginsengisoli Gsoil 348]